MVNVGCGRQLRGEELLERLPILGHNLQEKVGVAGEHVAFAHLWPAFNQLGKMEQIGFGVVGQANLNKYRQAIAHFVGGDMRVIAANVTGFFQSAHPAEAGRRRNARLFRQIDVAHAPIFLQLAQDFEIDSVEFDVLHPVAHKLGANDTISGECSGMQGKSQVTCWVVTDGKAGMENQCLGLAEALGLTPVVKRIRLRAPWRQLSPFLRHGLDLAFSAKGDAVTPPWPDLLIATGRHSVPASLLARRATMRKDMKRTFTVQIQNPVIDPSRFDLVVVPRHDALTGANVMSTRGSLHRVTDAVLRREAEKFLPQVAALPSPRVAVLIGGSNAVYSLTPREMAPLAAQLRALAQEGVGLMVTPSRRTGAENLAILQNALRDVPHFLWDGTGENPYYGMLGLADAILVTADSVNMVSEACSTGKPVMVIELPGGSDKFRRFHQALRDDGMTRPFAGKLEQWRYPPLNDMELVAARVRKMMGLSAENIHLEPNVAMPR